MSIRLKESFNARAVGSNVLLTCYGSECRVFGATVPVSSLPGEGALVRMAHLPHGQDRGLIAVAVYHQRSGDRIWSGCILELTRDKDGLAYVNLEHPWVPEGEQIVQVDQLGIHLTDAASGERFTTSEYLAKKYGLRYVPDGDLLMRCLAGSATVDEVRAAAQAQVEEQSMREQLAELEGRAMRMEARVDDLGRQNERLREIERHARAVRDYWMTYLPGTNADLSELLRALSVVLGE